MPHIVLTSEQMELVGQTIQPVEVRDPAGKVLTTIPTPSEQEFVARIVARRGQPRESIPGEVVQARLKRLEEIRQQEGMDEKKMRDLLRRMRAGEQV